MKKIKEEGDLRIGGDPDKNVRRNEECIWRSTQEILAVSKGGGGKMKGARWWNEEVKEKVKEKQDDYTDVVGGRTEEEKEVRKPTRKIARKEAKKKIIIVRTM